MSQNIIGVNQNEGLMNFIIGKAWKNGDNINIVFDRDNPSDVVCKAGSSLRLTDVENKKREGKVDADYSVSVLLPRETAETLINEKKALIAKRNENA